MTSERQARMAIAALTPNGAAPVARALAEFGAVDLWEAFLAAGETTAWGTKAAALDPAAVEAATRACGARFVIPGDDEWPAGLAGLDEASVAGQTGQPPGLWVLGRPLTEAAGAVAVVGSRGCSSYGEHATMTLAADLAAAGRTVVSGLAFGVDAAAHRGALGVRGHTVAVVGSGVDVPYPTAHRDLAAAVARSGSIVSEVPPGSRPTRGAFLARNRLIAALAEAVVIVEAAARSGAKNTATWAGALGRVLCAVPGPVTSSLSYTPHRLIREGEAILVSGAADVEATLAPLGARPEPSGRGAPVPIDRLRPALRELREAVEVGEEVSAAQLSGRTGQSMLDALAGAAELAEEGWLDSLPDGTYRLPGRPAPRT